MQVTSGAIGRIMAGENVENARLQVVDLAPIGDGARNRLWLSDGRHKAEAMCTIDVNHFITNGVLKVNCTLTLSEFVTKDLTSRKMIFIIKVDDIRDHPSVIGSPVTYTPGATAAAPTNSYSNARAGYSSSGPVQRTTAHQNAMPLLSLGPYSNRFTVVVRVTKKDQIRTWTNQRGSGKLFSVDLLDEHGTEIRGTFFNDQVDAFHTMIEVGKVYCISNGRVKLANRRYSSLDNEYELSFDRSTTIEPVRDDARISQVQYNFTTISAIEAMAAKSKVDVIGVVRNVSEATPLTTKAGKETTKRDVEIVDDSGAGITVTLWGAHADLPTANFQNNAVIAIKAASVGDYNGKSLSTWSTSRLDFNPEIPDTNRLQTWFAANAGSLGDVASLSRSGGAGGGRSNDISRRKTFSSIEEENLGQSDRGDYITVKATTTHIRNDSKNWYAACGRTKEDGKICQKGVKAERDWMCESCQQTSTNPQYRFMLSVILADHTGSSWTTMFNDAALLLLKDEASVFNDLYKKSEEEGAEPDGAATNELNRRFTEAQFQEFVVEAKVRTDMSRDEARKKVGVSRIRPINYAKESRNLLDAIAKYNV